MATWPKMIFQYVQDLRQKQAEELKSKVLELYLACHTQEEIAEMLGVDRTTVTKWISDVKNGQLAKNHIPESLQFYNLWQFNDCNPRYGMDYPGRIPGKKDSHFLCGLIKTPWGCFSAFASLMRQDALQQAKATG